MLRLAVANCFVIAVFVPTTTFANPEPTDDAEYVDDFDRVDSAEDEDPGSDDAQATCPLIDSESAESAESDDEGVDAALTARQGSPGRALSALEAAILEETNLLRKDPRGYAQKLIQLRPSYRGKLIHREGQASILTQEGVAALDEAIAVLKRAPKRLPRLAHAEGLSRAAADHARDLGRTGALGHTGSDGGGPDKRARRHGVWDGMVAENIAFGPTDSEEIVIGLLVDDGVPDRGHRDILLTQELFFGGVACGPHPGYGTTCVMTYATSFKSNGAGKRNSEADDEAARTLPPALPEPDLDTARSDEETTDDGLAVDDPWAPPTASPTPDRVREDADEDPRRDDDTADVDPADDVDDEGDYDQPPSYAPQYQPGPRYVPAPQYRPGARYYGPRYRPGARYYGPRYQQGGRYYGPRHAPGPRYGYRPY
jgi:uncharacterized protein YkwD